MRIRPSRRREPILREGPWSYGIITVPERVETYLPDTMKSLAAAGFDEPVLFVDGGASKLPENCRVVNFTPKVGQPANWITALFHLTVVNPGATRFALFEDDLLSCLDLKKYLDSCPFPEKGYWNLLTHNENATLANGVRGWHHSNQRGLGAVGLVFDRAGVDALLHDTKFITHGKGVDAKVITCLKPQGYIEYIHYPSLLQHMGSASTMGHKYGKVRYFPGTDYSPLEDMNRGQNERQTSN